MERTPLTRDEKWIVQYLVMRRLGFFPIYKNPLRDEFFVRGERMPVKDYERARTYAAILVEMNPETV